ncbi:MAG: helix-turn-helix domain-containing protein [Opitutaceae bacterium]|jgi:AraC family transcriptional regulator of arabinose operon|nr:helix-turn-helix domain-containing protein [Opitutaceae bacterium]
MTLSIKNMPGSMDTTAQSMLAKMARSLPDPGDYYQGRQHNARGLPDNILLFFRGGAKSLSDPDTPRHFHHRHVLVIPLSGRGRMVVDGRTYVLEPGRCALIFPYQFHHFMSSSGERTEWLFVTFEWPGHGVNGTIFIPKAGDFYPDLPRLLEDYRSPAHNSGDRLAHRLALLVMELASAKPARAESRKRANASEGLLLKMHDIVTGNMGRPPVVSGIARQLGISPGHFRARFRTIAGKSPRQFHREMRLQKAAELLVQNGLTVAETAAACGWESPFAFSRAFRAHWGKSPKRFALFAKKT